MATLSRRGITSTLLSKQSRHFSQTVRRPADFTHAVIGAGAVGLAIARQLQQRDGVTTILIEKHGAVGTETSSRNSEVIHAGLYYEPSSLKARLCIRGKQLLYDLCSHNSIPHHRCGKWIVAQDRTQLSALERLHSTASQLSVPTRFLTRHEIATGQPSVRAEAGVLLSPTTGILDSHAYMQYLHGTFTEAGGDTSFLTTVERISPPTPGVTDDWTVHVRSPSGHAAADDDDDDEHRVPVMSSFTTETLINAAGHGAVALANSLLPPARHLTAHHAKGTYYSYAAVEPRPTVLVYPAPVEGHGGLGTHLTLDLRGKVRFGPDVQWVSAVDYSVVPDEGRLREAVRAIREYLPGMQEGKVEVDYCGVRPKLVGQGMGSRDFYIIKEDGVGGGLVNLCGIESPGLTSSLAIAEYVDELLYK